MSNRLHSFHGHSDPEPIGLEYIVSSLNQLGYTYTFLSSNELEIIDSLNGKTISLFTALTSEWEKVLLLASEAKKRGNFTIVGGYHTSGLSGLTDRESIPEVFDLLIAGEGEEIVLKILEEYGSKGSFDRYESKIIKSSPIQNLDSLAFPHRDARFLSNYNLLDLMWPPASLQRNVAIILASRGCLYNCDFCASSSVWGRGVRYRSVNNVINELEDLRNRFGTNTLLVIDQSFGQNKKWTTDLCENIQAAHFGMNWYHQSNLSLTKETIYSMAKAGCTKIGFGMEGISPSAIDFIKPQNPHDYNAINDLFDYCNSLGIFIKVYLMIGFPWETKEIIRDYFQWITMLRANEIKISYFTPFPGTKVWEKHSNSLVSANWEDFDTVSKAVVYNPNISIADYHRIRQTLFNKFYSSDTYSDVTHRMITNYPHYHLSFKEFVPYLKQFNMVTGEEEWMKWFNDEAKMISLNRPVIKHAEFF